jgi:hypothetical protein
MNPQDRSNSSSLTSTNVSFLTSPQLHTWTVLVDLAAKRQVRHANPTERLTTKPPLCLECAKPGKHSPSIRGTGWTRTGG